MLKFKKKKSFLKYTTKDGLLSDNFSRIYQGNTRITKSTLLSLKSPLHSIFTPQVNNNACLITTALKYFCHNRKAHRKDSLVRSVRSSDAIHVFRVWTVVSLGTREGWTHWKWTTEQILKATVTYCVLCQTISYTGLFNSWHKSFCLSPRLSWKQLDEKVFLREDGKYFVKTVAAQSTEIEDSWIPNPHWGILNISSIFSSGIWFYYLINGLQYLIIIVNNTTKSSVKYFPFISLFPRPFCTHFCTQNTSLFQF